MRTRIISAFPGTGKTHYCDIHRNTAKDLESSEFSWDINNDYTKVRNPKFPQNYINAIKECIGKYDFVFVSSHLAVRKALIEECLFFYVFYPNVNRKEEYLQRYRIRGNNEHFIDLLDKNWEDWIHSCNMYDYGCKTVSMIYPYLEDELVHLVSKEDKEIQQ